jgi:hypothetical protein
MRTFDQSGRLIGDTAPTDGVTYDPVTGEAIQPALTVTAAPIVPGFFDALMKPPTVYYVGAALAFVAWAMSSKKSRR